MLWTWGPGVQENWDLWLNASVIAYNTTINSCTGVTPHYAMFRQEATLPVDWVFPTPYGEKRIMYHWTGEMMEEIQPVYKSMREVQGGRVRRNKPLTQNIRAGCLVWYFNPRIIPGTSNKLRSFWAGPYRVMKLIVLALVEIEWVYYPESSRFWINGETKES